MLQPWGSLQACSLCLVHVCVLVVCCTAGIPMRDMVAAVAVGFLQKTPLLDLNQMEDAGGGPDISVALHPQSGKLVLLQVRGNPACTVCVKEGLVAALLPLQVMSLQGQDITLGTCCWQLLNAPLCARLRAVVALLLTPGLLSFCGGGADGQPDVSGGF